MKRAGFFPGVRVFLVERGERACKSLCVFFLFLLNSHSLCGCSWAGLGWTGLRVCMREKEDGANGKECGLSFGDIATVGTTTARETILLNTPKEKKNVKKRIHNSFSFLPHPTPKPAFHLSFSLPIILIAPLHLHLSILHTSYCTSPFPSHQRKTYPAPR